VGAEIGGVDMSRPLDETTLAAVRQALLDHLVIFFRDQAITPEQHLAFARQFGPVNAGVAKRTTDVVPGITVLDQVKPRGEGTDTWHSDHFFQPEPPLGTILRAVQLPSVGGDTCFASMYAAYDALSASMQRFVDELWAEHDITRSLTRAIERGHTDLDLRATQERLPPVVHPVAIVHPETGRRALFVNPQSTTRILDLAEGESRMLLAYLYEHVKSPEFQCRVRWDDRSVVFLDNRCVQHCAVADYHERRVLHRVTIKGGVLGPAMDLASTG
jgi:taurine dioxygenase